MRKKRITLEYLQKKVWWWRPGAENHPVSPAVPAPRPSHYPAPFDPHPATFDPGNILAFNYELARRADRSRCLAPFTALRSPHYAIIHTSLGKPFVLNIPSRYAGNESQENEKGWSYVRPKLQWNLNLSERALGMAFLDFIRQERKVQGIIAQTKPGRRPFSWKWLEWIDISDFKICSLDDSERGTLAKARKAAKRQLNLFDKAIESYWEQQVEDTGKPDLDMVAFLESSPPVVSEVRLWKHIWPLEMPE